MNNHSPFTQRFEQLPHSLPVFPLLNAVMMPGAFLPLNIFEPRYLNMFTDAMKGDQLIGMIQPKDKELSGNPPPLFQVGCAGRITRYEETNDGRLAVMLAGLCRFKIEKEITNVRGYRVVVPDWSEYQHDYEDQGENQENTLMLNGALRQYFTEKNVEVNWDSFEEVSTEVLLNNMIGQLPFTPQDKQMLIEIPDLETRVKSFCALLEVEKESDKKAH